MHIHTDKSSDDKSNQHIQETNTGSGTGEGAFTFDDQRSEAAAQRRLVNLMQSGGPVVQLQGEDETPTEPEDISEEAEHDQETDDLSEDMAEFPDGDDEEEELSPEEYIDRIMTSHDGEITLFDETHHLEHRLVNGEHELGVASTWEQLKKIHIALRTLHGTTAQWRNLWRDLDKYMKNVKRYQKMVLKSYKEYVDARNEHKHLKQLDQSAIATAKAFVKMRKAQRKHMDHEYLLNEALEDQKSTAAAFVRLSALLHGTETAEILGADMPVIEYDTDADATTDVNNKRYHKGTQTDPIPITWYKPAASYLPVTVNDQLTNGPVTLHPFTGNNQQVQDANGNNWDFGVVQTNQIGVGTVLRNMPKHGKARTTQVALNAVLTSMGYNMHNKDGDHVKDLGFGGNDVIGNYWPLDSTINRYAFNGWRSTYYLNFKTGKNKNGRKEVKKAALNSGSLIGKYVQVVATQAASSPAGNNTSASGSSTAWGTSELINDNQGNQMQEG